MEVRFNEEGEVLVAKVEGEINISTSPQLKKDFEKVDSKKVIVNLDGVGYVDSSGLATLVELLKKTRARGGTLHLTNLSDKVKSLFEITKLDKLFGIYPDVEGALAELK